MCLCEKITCKRYTQARELGRCQRKFEDACVTNTCYDDISICERERERMSVCCVDERGRDWKCVQTGHKQIGPSSNSQFI